MLDLFDIHESKFPNDGTFKVDDALLLFIAFISTMLRAIYKTYFYFGLFVFFVCLFVFIDAIFAQ